MNGLLLIVVGVAVLFLVLSGKADCFVAALRACYSGATPAAVPTTGTNQTQLGPAQAVLDNVLSAQTSSDLIS